MPKTKNGWLLDDSTLVVDYTKKPEDVEANDLKSKKANSSENDSSTEDGEKNVNNR
jgi:hypothetical protein